jgi:hypothetical protein
MKKILTLAVFGGLLAATTLQAQVQIYVCGSTAFRSNAYRAIRSMFDGGVPTSQNTGSTANNSGAGQMTFQGTITPLYRRADGDHLLRLDRFSAGDSFAHCHSW